MPTSTTPTVPVSEQARWPRSSGTPHPQLQGLLARDYTGFTEATTPPQDSAGPASAAVGIILTLQDSPGLPPEFLDGARSTFRLPDGASVPAYVGLWLAPLGAYRLLGMPINTLSGQLVDLTDVLGAGIRRLADQLRDTPSWQQRFGLLDEFLLRRAQDGSHPAPEVAWAWQRLLTTGGRLPIRRLASEVGWSHKHLITRFTQQIGLAPKTAARLVRFEAVCRRLATHPSPPARWDQLAAESGYADQAHLIRDCRQFTGATPTAFLTRPPTCQRPLGSWPLTPPAEEHTLRRLANTRVRSAPRRCRAGNRRHVAAEPVTNHRRAQACAAYCGSRTNPDRNRQTAVTRPAESSGLRFGGPA